MYAISENVMTFGERRDEKVAGIWNLMAVP
jgi:hypothetical protein